MRVGLIRLLYLIADWPSVAVLIGAYQNSNSQKFNPRRAAEI
jgi:hypothetical protein